MTNYSDLFFGTYTLKSAQLIILPISKNKNDEPKSESGEVLMNGGSVWGSRLRKRMNPQPAAYKKIKSSKKRARIAPPPPPPPPVVIPPVPPVPNISGLGIMDVGMGNCALLFDQAREPVVYFDVGYPLFFFTSSVPNTLRPTIGGVVNPAYEGPIMNNVANNLSVFLSHWDWDHWRLGRVAGLQHLQWTYPVQPLGPSSLAFSVLLAANGTANPYPVGTPSMVFNDFRLYECTPPLGGPAAMIMNNSGLALEVTTLLPFVDPVHHEFILTGDCNFGNTNIVMGNVTGVLAVHHGSNNHGAAAGLPNPVAPYAASGRIAYSYGISAGGNHCYGFPVPAAVAAYQAAGWGVPLAPPPPTNQESTAEGNQINAVPPGVAARGNILVGDQTALPLIYNGTAFFNYPNALT